MKLFELIKSDLARIDQNVGIKSFLRWYFIPKGYTFPYCVWYRIFLHINHNYGGGGIKKLLLGGPSYLMYKHYEKKYDIHGNSNIEIGPGFMVVHGSGVYLNVREIGSCFTVYQGVTLGTGGDHDIPIVGDGVTIYPNAVVCGGIHLGNGCIVGANAFVSSSVAERNVVAGVPAKVVKILNERDSVG